MRLGCSVMIEQLTGMTGNDAPLRKLGRRALIIGTLSFTLGGCASVSIPFGDVFETEPMPLHTASADAPATEADTAEDAPLPPELSAVAPVDRDSTETASDRPADDLIANLSPAAPRVSLSQADLNAMGRALTHVLSTDEDAGTFSWSHETTGRSGLMTPFRQLSASNQGSCRIVSVEITDNGNNTILLADACLQDDEWVFVTPRAGEIL